jgi:hypothetical protein
MLDAQTRHIYHFLWAFIWFRIRFRSGTGHRVRVDTVARYARYLKCASRAWRAGVYAATSCRARARVSAVAAPCASAHRGSVGRSSSALRHGPTPVEGWRQAQPWRYVGAGRTSAHNTCFLSLRARASRLRKHLTAPLRVRHLETSDDHDDERRGRVECRWSSAAGRVPRALGLETEPDPRNPRPRGPQASEHPS